MWDFSKLPKSEYQKAADLFLANERIGLKELLKDTYGVYAGSCDSCYYEQIQGMMQAQLSTGILSQTEV